MLPRRGSHPESLLGRDYRDFDVSCVKSGSTNWEETPISYGCEVIAKCDDVFDEEPGALDAMRRIVA